MPSTARPHRPAAGGRGGQRAAGLAPARSPCATLRPAPPRPGRTASPVTRSSGHSPPMSATAAASATAAWPGAAWRPARAVAPAGHARHGPQRGRGDRVRAVPAQPAQAAASRTARSDRYGLLPPSARSIAATAGWRSSRASAAPRPANRSSRRSAASGSAGAGQRGHGRAIHAASLGRRGAPGQRGAEAGDRAGRPRRAAAAALASGAVVGLVSVLLLAAGALAWRAVRGPAGRHRLAAGWPLRTLAPESTPGRVTAGRVRRRPVGAAGGCGCGRCAAGAARAGGVAAPPDGRPGPRDRCWRGRSGAAGRHGGRPARPAWRGPPRRRGPGGPPNMPAMLAGLRHVSLTDAQVDVADGSFRGRPCGCSACGPRSTARPTARCAAKRRPRRRRPGSPCTWPCRPARTRTAPRVTLDHVAGLPGRAGPGRPGARAVGRAGCGRARCARRPRSTPAWRCATRRCTPSRGRERCSCRPRAAEPAPAHFAAMTLDAEGDYAGGHAARASPGAGAALRQPADHPGAVRRRRAAGRALHRPCRRRRGPRCWRPTRPGSGRRAWAASRAPG